MNGAASLIKTAAERGIEVCFANPGTTEAPLVAALDGTPEIKPVLGLFEGVCTGAADGYGRMKGKPAMTVLHLGPGFANGIANLHNGRRAGSPIVNIIGEHASWHREADAPLAMDIETLARTVSRWCRTSSSAENLSRDMAEAVSASMRGLIATLIVPHDHQLKECAQTAAAAASSPRSGSLDTALVEKAASFLRESRKPALLLGGDGVLEEGLKLAGRVRAFTGADLLVVNFPGRVERGAGLPPLTRIPYFPEPALSILSAYDAIVLIGAKEPVTFFGYTGVDSYLISKEQKKLSLVPEGESTLDTLEYLAGILEGTGKAFDGTLKEEYRRPEAPSGSLAPEKVCLALASVQPEGAIIVDEGLTTGFHYYPLTGGLPRHSLLTIGGGSIGYGMPAAAGAALACPDRPVINLQADGSALYTVQALWTQARESLNVTTLLCSNRSYQIVRVELERAGVVSPGPAATTLTDLGNPVIDWVKVAQGFGVPGRPVDSVEGLLKELKGALEEPGPHLIEMRL